MAVIVLDLLPRFFSRSIVGIISKKEQGVRNIWMITGMKRIHPVYLVR
jgi:hypothetical protein